MSLFLRTLCIVPALGLTYAGWVSVSLAQDDEQLTDEVVQMQVLMQRMQSQMNEETPAAGGKTEKLSPLADQDTASDPIGASREPIAHVVSADSAVREFWLRRVERSVLGRFADQFVEADNFVTVVEFVGGEEIPRFGRVQVREQGTDDRMTPPEVQARLAVVPRFSDGGFLHAGLLFQSSSLWEQSLNFDSVAVHDVPFLGSGYSLGIELEYVQDTYSIQAHYLTSDTDGTQAKFGTHSDTESADHQDGFHIQGAWSIVGERSEPKYASSSLSYLTTRPKDDVWELVMRYTNLGEAVRGQNSDSLSLGLHWQMDSSLVLELDYVEGSIRDFQALTDGGVTVRGMWLF